ncbi:MAG: Holliday junction branch migration protein RuvA [Flavobacteriales bacterium CG_4_9_14_0_2_um_filter_35_242]|nr:Holliday junction branch migration protein RuvA [Zetaproteobacteria bacterium]NDK17573.1 Holliday junction branch migration protein RuvA [Flavobacteriales bacterium]OIO08974.1 MAG: Holliday junction DNA helicase RuvA [Flavobacteriaceae bacterium CG1_02_35_72]PIR12274.1 MAG: Holliday junction branch migration protein RuvA [Flavobacteriales bacterium CG11_big_fil_rev_8_21_14_0_20_35_7]PIV17224.1 MAG: Holliday junction branch migration protein RuvA [Flavobacteriales bacterium CG03_land_8_20_14_
MICHLKGKLVEKTPTYVIIECNGVGYKAHISLHTYSQIADSELIKLETLLLVKEDSQTLYGFFDKTEREIFKLLISVSGVGPSIARIMLSSMTPTQIQEAIVAGNVATIQSVKGLGAKTAQRLILDLKDKILKTFEMPKDLFIQNNTIKDEALSALEVLGYNRRQSEKTVQKLILEHADGSLEDIIKLALKNL